MSADAETILRGARRPLVVGMGGGGDVVGALATAEFCRLYDGAEPTLGGLSWERRPVDPRPGPRAAAEIEGAQPLAPGALLAGPRTRVRDSDIHFGESRMAAFLNRPTVLLTLEGGPAGVAASLAAASRHLHSDLLVLVDVGGDVLAQGEEPGLRSPLCDAVLLAAGRRLAGAGLPVLLGIFGIGCDGELTAEEVLAQVAAVAEAGGLAGVRGLTAAVAERLAGAIELVPTEASAQALRAFQGTSGTVTIRGGQRSFELSTLAACTFYLDVEVACRRAGRLAAAVDGADSVVAASRRLNEIGVRTELDLETEAAARAVP